MRNLICIILLPVILFLACRNDKIPTKTYKTKYVVIILMDGARYTETYGSPTKEYIPNLFNSLSSKGSWNNTFYNTGATNTVNGHVAITTGFIENNLDNNGNEQPSFHSLFQDWLKANPLKKNKAWIITSKDKLEILSNTIENNWKNHFLPSVDCGLNGLGSGYRDDSVTYAHSIKVIEKHHPNLLLINFKDPDVFGHAGDYAQYVNSIQVTDFYIMKIWNAIESDPEMAGNTTLIVTNDHGRHTSNFQHHGDDCDGCRHIMFYTCGPDFKSDYVISNTRSLIDIHATVSELLGIQNYRRGNVMTELFK